MNVQCFSQFFFQEYSLNTMFLLDYLKQRLNHVHIQGKKTMLNYWKLVASVYSHLFGVCEYEKFTILEIIMFLCFAKHTQIIHNSNDMMDHNNIKITSTLIWSIKFAPFRNIQFMIVVDFVKLSVQNLVCTAFLHPFNFYVCFLPHSP